MISMLMTALLLQASLDTTARPPRAAQFAFARDLLDARLLDYPTARFRDVHGDERLICGFVNAKNRMGAFSGWSRFGVTLFSDEPRLLIDDPDERDDLLLDTFCGEDGTKLGGTDYSGRLTAD